MIKNISIFKYSMSDKIYNPITGRFVNKNSVLGKKILNGLIKPTNKIDKKLLILTH